MATRKELEETELKLSKARNQYKEKRYDRKLCEKIGLGGIICLAYVGLRALCGADISKTIISPEETPQNLIQFIDTLTSYIGVFFTPVGMFSSLISYFGERGSKKDIKKTKENLMRIKEDYNFSRGYD